MVGVRAVQAVESMDTSFLPSVMPEKESSCSKERYKVTPALSHHTRDELDCLHGIPSLATIFHAPTAIEVDEHD